MEHGRVVGANMAGQPLAYRGSLLMNIVEVQGLEIASFGAWDDTTAEVFSALKPERPAYRKLLWHDDRITGAMILGRAEDVWTTNDVGMLKGLVQSGIRLGDWKPYLRHHLFEIKGAYIAAGTTARLLPQTVLGRPSIPAAPLRPRWPTVPTIRWPCAVLMEEGIVMEAMCPAAMPGRFCVSI